MFEQIDTSIVAYPVILKNDEAYIKKQLRIDLVDSEDDDYIQEKIYEATEDTEEKCNKEFSKTYNTLEIKNYSGYFVEIPKANYLSIVSITDDASTQITDYKIYKYPTKFRIEFENSLSSDPLTINFYTGFESGKCPKHIRNTILIRTADLMNSRDSWNYSSINYNGLWEKLCAKIKKIY